MGKCLAYGAMAILLLLVAATSAAIAGFISFMAGLAVFGESEPQFLALFLALLTSAGVLLAILIFGGRSLWRHAAEPSSTEDRGRWQRKWRRLRGQGR